MKKQIKRIDITPTNSSALKAKNTEIRKISSMVEESMKDWNPNPEKNYKGALRLLDELKKDKQKNRDNEIKSKFKSELIQKVLSDEPANFGVPEAKLIKKDSTDGKELEAKIDKLNKISKGIETEMKYTKIFEDTINYLQGYNDSAKNIVREKNEKVEKLNAELNSGISGVINRLFGIGPDKK